MTVPVLPASPLQRGIWVTERAAGPSGTYHLPVVVRLRGPLQVDRLLAACSAVADRHPALRRVPSEHDHRLVMVDGAAVPVDRVDAAAFAERLSRPFDLATGPLARFALAEDGADEHVLGFVAHHLVFDGHSKEILVRDLAAFYNGAQADLPELSDPAGPAPSDPVLLAEATTWWDRHWPPPGPTLGRGGPLPERSSGRGAERRSSLAAPGAPGLSGFEALLTALHVLLWGYGNATPVTAVVLATRAPDGRDDDRIGLFVNEVPFTTRPAATATFAEFGADVRRTLRDLYRFRAVPLALARPGLRPHSAVAPVSLSYRTGAAGAPVFTGLTAEVDWLAWGGAARGAVQIVVAEQGDAGTRMLELSVRHDAELDAAPMVDDLLNLLAAAEADPDKPLVDLVSTLPRHDERDSRRSLTDESPVRHQGSAALREQVREIWQEVLRIAPIHDDDDLFELGGHSLNITQIIARLRATLRLDISLDEFFDHPTVAGVVEVARRG